MKSAHEIVNDPINGRFAYTLLTDEEWQTLKRFVLAKQTNNKRIMQSVDNSLEVGDGSDY